MRDPRYAQLRLRIPATHTFITAEPPANDAAAEDPAACQGLPGLFHNVAIQCVVAIVVCSTVLLAFILDGRGKN